MEKGNRKRTLPRESSSSGIHSFKLLLRPRPTAQPGLHHLHIGVHKLVISFTPVVERRGIRVYLSFKGYSKCTTPAGLRYARSRSDQDTTKPSRVNPNLGFILSISLSPLCLCVMCHTSHWAGSGCQSRLPCRTHSSRSFCTTTRCAATGDGFCTTWRWKWESSHRGTCWVYVMVVKLVMNEKKRVGNGV